MKKYIKKLLICLIFANLLLITNSLKVHAVLQANVPDETNTSLTNTTISDFFSAIREMEYSNGTIGATSDGTSGNGIDCHVAKNTEWGTAAMLSASKYGEAPEGESSASTTGNNSGIFQMADGTYEYVAGLYKKIDNSNTSNIAKANDKYRNDYTSSTSIPGDRNV